jgi:hypothetical protein
LSRNKGADWDVISPKKSAPKRTFFSDLLLANKEQISTNREVDLEEAEQQTNVH